MLHPVKRLVAVAEEVFSLPRGQLLLLNERGANDHISHRRQLVYLVANEAGFSTSSIGKQIGTCHRTVRYGVNVARKRVADPAWAERKAALEEEWAYTDDTTAAARD